MSGVGQKDADKDAALVARFVSDRTSPDGQSAFNELVNRYYNKLVHIVTQRLKGDRDAAEDIAQETFMRILKHAEKFDPARSTFSKWFFWCGEKIFFDEHRRRKAKKTLTNYQTNHDSVWQDFDMEDLKQPRPDVTAQVNEFRQTFWTAVDSLPPAQREAICLIVVEHLSYRAAEAKCGVYYRTIAKRVEAALPAIKDALGDVPDLHGMSLERRSEVREEPDTIKMPTSKREAA